MHKQRLPFNGGPGAFGASGFNFNAPQFGDSGGFGPGTLPEGLNEMPFLGKSPTNPLMRSISRQRSLDEGGGLDSLPPPPPLPVMAQRLLSGGLGRGPRVGVPPIPGFYGAYEGDLSAVKETAAAASSYPKKTQNPGSPRSPQLTAISDTDSESDLCSQLKGSTAPESCCRRVLGCLMNTLPDQRRRQVEKTMERCSQTAIAKHFMVLLQLLTLVAGLAFRQVKRIGWICGGVRFRVGRAKFQLRSTLRHMLWRLANAKGNDTLLFLVVVLVTPWLFLLSLVGFAFSFVFSMKNAVAEGSRQVHRRVL
ncbi:uncharacterized protein LOC108100322 [Drosophila ficusphila]|uniref:uncharacterized protein LOC108100322 n=1 Tax=Drosophila ficusphila TaxID=30025 RepID=UPI0007E5EE40|nr:uncharacterized protein LOC108100322 [Drosophila ficusphila]